jgi:hypothetical protein
VATLPVPVVFMSLTRHTRRAQRGAGTCQDRFFVLSLLSVLASTVPHTAAACRTGPSDSGQRCQIQVHAVLAAPPFLEKGIYINIPDSASAVTYSYSLLHHKQITTTQS